MKTIRLGVFCEDYWSKGLIYTQNILPLKQLCDKKNVKFEIISFTSLFMYVTNYRAIRRFKKEMKEQNIRIIDLCTYYIPTRYMTSWWFNIPILYLSTLFYIIYLRILDHSKDVTYNLRSYEISYLFLKQYGKTDNLIFDPRTDWIEENVNSGYFNENGISVKFWNRVERHIIQSFKKSIFISDVFKNNMIAKHNLQNDEKLCVLYNPIDYNHFSLIPKKHDNKTFLYTGSLGTWNRLENYLNFFKSYYDSKGDGRLLVCTSTSRARVESILNNNEYESIRNCVEVKYNVPYSELPLIYSECDYGLQLMMKKDSRVGVKVIEYIAAGIQPIVHENVQGAAFICEKYNIGIVIHANDSKQKIIKKIESLQTLDKESANYKVFQNLSDLNCISNQLNNIYLH